VRPHPVRTKERRSPAFTALVALAGAAMLFLSLPNIGPALRAARLDGSAGVFTARRLACIQHPGHESCSWTGEFRSDDGTVHRTGVTLYGGDSGSLRVGRHVRAVDVGRPSRVYARGSREWVFNTILLLGGAALFGGALVRYALNRSRRRRSPRPPAGPDPERSQVTR